VAIVYTSATTPATDQTFYFKLVHPVNGQPKTGLTITDLDLTYTRDRAVAVKNDLTALTNVDDPHSDNKAKEVNATNCPGLYRVDFPDAAFATGVSRVVLGVNGSNIDPAYIEVDLLVPPNEASVNVATISNNAITANSINNDAITAAKIATNAIDADSLAADAVDEILDEVVEGSYTLRQLVRLISSVLFAEVTGGGTTTITFRDIGDTKNRVVATVDSSGNRTAMTLDGT